MKKLFSIAFITILLLNVMGYYGLFLGVRYGHDIAMTKVLDSYSYDESQTIILKIPVSIPYVPDNDFQRVDGKFEHEGEVYRMVKQKYEKDTVTVVCVKDQKDTRINQALSRYVKTFTNDASDPDSGSKITFSFIKDYLPQTFSVHSMSSGWMNIVAYHSFHRTLTPTFSSSVVHPPERG